MKKKKLKFLSKSNGDYKLVISRTGRELILILNDQTAITLSLVELTNMTKFALIKQYKKAS